MFKTVSGLDTPPFTSHVRPTSEFGHRGDVRRTLRLLDQIGDQNWADTYWHAHHLVAANVTCLPRREGSPAHRSSRAVLGQCPKFSASAGAAVHVSHGRSDLPVFDRSTDFRLDWDGSVLRFVDESNPLDVREMFALRGRLLELAHEVVRLRAHLVVRVLSATEQELAGWERALQWRTSLRERLLQTPLSLPGSVGLPSWGDIRDAMAQFRPDQQAVLDAHRGQVLDLAVDWSGTLLQLFGAVVAVHTPTTAAW